MVILTSYQSCTGAMRAVSTSAPRLASTSATCSQAVTIFWRNGQILLPEMAQQADAQPGHGSGRGVLRLGAGSRVLRVVSGENVQQQPTVFGRPGQRPAVVEGEGVGNDAAPAYQAVARHQTGGAGKRGRSTDRAAGIGAERPEAESGRHRHGRPG